MQTDMLGRTPHSINVGSLDSMGSRAYYSSIGSNIWLMGFGGGLGEEDTENNSNALISTLSHYNYKCNEWPTDILDDEPIFREKFDPNCYYTGTFNGTSASKPTVTGVIALMLQANPNLTVDQIKYILAKTSRNDINAKKDRHDWSSLAYEKVSVPFYNGKDDETILVDDGRQNNTANMRFSNYYGFGVFDAKAAVKKVLDEEAKEKDNQDPLYVKRQNHPTILKQSDPSKIECSKIQESTDALNVYSCKIHGLDSSSLDQKEIEYVEFDLKGFDFLGEQATKEDFCKLPINKYQVIKDAVDEFMPMNKSGLSTFEPEMVKAINKLVHSLKLCDFGLCTYLALLMSKIFRKK